MITAMDDKYLNGGKPDGGGGSLIAATINKGILEGKVDPEKIKKPDDSKKRTNRTKDANKSRAGTRSTTNTL
jgi:hypothetical protein